MTKKVYLQPVQEWRRARMLELKARFGSFAALAKAADASESYLSQVNNQTRGMGSDFARKLEAGLGLERGWLDRPMAEDVVREGPPPAAVESDPRLDRIIEAWPALTKAQRDDIVRSVIGVERSNREILKEILSGDQKTGTD